jgi:hypothetical protein
VAPEPLVRDEQVRRYARHILLPDVGGLGQTALLVSSARIDVSQPAAVIAASYLAAGGTGTIVASKAGEAELVALRAFNPDCKVVTDAPAETRPRPVLIDDEPPWWPLADDRAQNRVALDFWRGSISAVRWMSAILNG